MSEARIKELKVQLVELSNAGHAALKARKPREAIDIAIKSRPALLELARLTGDDEFTALADAGYDLIVKGQEFMRQGII